MPRAKWRAGRQPLRLVQAQPLGQQLALVGALQHAAELLGPQRFPTWPPQLSLRQTVPQPQALPLHQALPALHALPLPLLPPLLLHTLLLLPLLPPLLLPTLLLLPLSPPLTRGRQTTGPASRRPSPPG